MFGNFVIGISLMVVMLSCVSFGSCLCIFLKLLSVLMCSLYSIVLC